LGKGLGWGFLFASQKNELLKAWIREINGKEKVFLHNKKKAQNNDQIRSG
jgi:hypothetical protein